MSALYDEATRRQILNAARKNLLGHVSLSDPRAAEAFALARANAVPLDFGEPKRSTSEPTLEQQAAVWRSQRIKRELADARATLARGVHNPPSHVPGEIVHKIKQDAYVAPEAPSPNLREPKVSHPDTPVDWSEHIAAAVSAERDYQAELLAHVIANTRGEVLDDLERAIQPLTAELASLKATLAELRVALAEERGKTLDIPNVLGRRAPAN